MKNGLILIAAMLSLLASAGGAAVAAVTAAGSPNAVITDLKYEFDKVVDGALVTHDFTVKNTGQGILEISRVKTG